MSSMVVFRDHLSSRQLRLSLLSRSTGVPPFVVCQGSGVGLNPRFPRRRGRLNFDDDERGQVVGALVRSRARPVTCYACCVLSPLKARAAAVTPARAPRSSFALVSLLPPTAAWRSADALASEASRYVRPCSSAICCASERHVAFSFSSTSSSIRCQIERPGPPPAHVGLHNSPARAGSSSSAVLLALFRASARRAYWPPMSAGT